MNARTRIQAIAIGIGLGLTGGCYAGPSGVDDVDEGIIYRTNENNSLHLSFATMCLRPSQQSDGYWLSM